MFLLAAALNCACTRAPRAPARYALLPFDNLTGDDSLNWIASTAPRIVSAEIGTAARPVATIGDAYLDGATRFVHGYFTKAANTLHLTVEVEDSATHKMVQTDALNGPVLADATAVARLLDPKAQPFSTSNEEAIAAWGRGDFEKAVALDPSFGEAWLSWIDTLARSGDTAGAIQAATRALEHPVQPETDGLRIALSKATLEKDPQAEHDALLKLTARVSDPDLLGRLGEIETLAREFALAVDDYKKLVAIEPDNAQALNLLGYAFGFDGKVSDAEATFARYAKLPGQEPNSYDSLGEAYFMNGKFADAEKAFLKAQVLNASLLADDDLRKAAYARWLAGDLGGADQLFGKYLDARAKRKDPALEWEHARWEYATGRKDQAIARLAKSPTPQNEAQLQVWRASSAALNPAQLKKAYELTQPSSDGLYRTFYAAELVKEGDKEQAKKLAARWPLPDNAGPPLLQPAVFPQYIEVRRILGL